MPMKTLARIVLTFVACSMSMLFISCEKNTDFNQSNGEPETEAPYLKVNGEKRRTLNYDGGSFVIWIDSNTEWVCAISAPKELDMKIDKSKSYGDDVINVTYASTRNQTHYSALTGTLTIRWTNSSGSKSVETITFVRNKNPQW